MQELFTLTSANTCFQKSVFFHISYYLFPAATTHLRAIRSLCSPPVSVSSGSGVKHVSPDIEKSQKSPLPKGEGMEAGGGVDLKRALGISLHEWPFCGEFPIIRALTSTNNDLLRTCREPRITEIPLAEHTKPSSCRGKEGGSSGLVSQNLLTKIQFFTLSSTSSVFPSPHIPTVGWR